MDEFVGQVISGEIEEKAKNVSIRKTHTATVTVGKDTIEAEYFTFNRNLGLNELDWTLWDKITIPFYQVKNWIKDTYWEIRYGFQRMFNGYDYVDTFEIFAKFIERYTKILTRYRKHHVGYVFEMTAEEWDAVIDEMLYHLKYMDEETVIKELERNVSDNWSASHKTVNFILDKHKNEFFELFSKYFWDLWD